MPIFNNVLAGASGGAGAGGYAIERSLRFNSADSAYLNRTPSSAGNRKTWTWSGWVKKVKVAPSDESCLFGDIATNLDCLRFRTDDAFEIFWKVGVTNKRKSTAAVFRDPSAWYHIVVSCDTTQALEANRVKIYINGVEETVFGTNNTIDQNYEWRFNNNTEIGIGKRGTSNDPLDAYLADVHFIDGQALAPTDFGEIDGNGVWQPKAFAGSYNVSTPVYSNYLTAPNGFVSGEGATNAFDGSTSTRAKVQVANDIITFDLSSLSLTGSFEFYATNAASEYSLDGGTTWTSSASNSYTTATSDISGVSNIQLKSSAGTTMKVTAFKNQGIVLVDGGTGVNGFHLDFADNSSNAALGTDTSGNSNTWTVNNLSVAAGANNDSLVDSPTNGDTASDTGLGNQITGNYATLNPLDKRDSPTFSNGNLQVNGSGAAHCVGRATFAVSSGKWYWETTINSAIVSTYYPSPGICSMDGAVPNQLGDGASGHAYMANGQKYTSAALSSYGASFTNGDILGFALDLDAGTLTAYKNGASQGVLTVGLTGSWSPSWSHYQSTSLIYNFGQRAFAYAAPSGYKSLNTANLSSTIADGSQYFDTKLWTGNGSTQSITGYNFSPDFVWYKCRSSSSNLHGLFDIVRGTTKQLYSNNVNQEATYSGVTAFNSDGFDLGSDNGGNEDTQTYVGWAWDAAANSDKTYTVTVSGGKFYIDGAQQPTLTLAEGSTYKFDQADSTNATHPLRFSTTSDGTHGGGTEYTTGVTTAGTPGSAGAYTQILIAASAPTLYAYCTNHSGMGFQVNTSDKGGYTIPVGGLTSSAYDQSQTWSSTPIFVDNGYGANGTRVITNAFNGVFTTSSAGMALPAIGGTWKLDFGSNFSNTTTVEIQYYGGAGSSGVLKLNGVDKTSNLNLNATSQTIVFNVSSLDSIEWSYPVANQYCYIGQVKVDGKLLVDSGVSVTNVPSIASTVRANPSAGFSIVKYTAAGTASTIGHSLNAAPEMIFVKRTDANASWSVYHASTGNAKVFELNGAGSASPSSTAWNSTTPTSSVFSIGNYPDTGDDLGTYIAYCFSSVEGYSSVGSYTGNASSTGDGPFVYTGFKPSWILFKNTGSGSWNIYDTARDAFNVAEHGLLANSSNDEFSGSPRCDFLSNGFKVRALSGAAPNAAADYIYIAFAEHPFASNGGLAR